MSRKGKIGIIVAIAVVMAIGLATQPRIPQWPSYHAFADTRPVGPTPNGWNVLSNLAFLIVGWLGLRFLARGPSTKTESKRQLSGAHTALGTYRERPAYVIFFTGILLTAFGSAYYHLAPSTPRLFFDRLPMAIAFTALFATVIAERISPYWSRMLLLPLLAIGIGSVVHWKVTEDAGAGDMRVYIFVQAFPMIAIPVIMMLFDSAYTRSGELLLVILVYAGAKALEVFDAKVFELTQRTVSGHTLKHVVAALAAYVVLDMLQHRSRKAFE